MCSNVRFATIDSMNAGEEESSEEEGQAFYAGGSETRLVHCFNIMFHVLLFFNEKQRLKITVKHTVESHFGP